jgi:hypothetical protein
MHFFLVRWWCWILSYDACELWISVNLDAGSNFCEFSHILAGSRMQTLMAANPGWFQDATGKQAAGYCRGGLRICNECFLKLVTDTDHWSLSNGLQLEHQLQTCQQSNGHRQSSLPVLTGGPHNMARSSRHQRRRFTTRISYIDFTVTGFILVPVTNVPCGTRETVIFTWPVTSCGNGCERIKMSTWGRGGGWIVEPEKSQLFRSY